MARLEGKVALVTGAGPNIGSGLAYGLAMHGAKVACNDLSPEAAEKAAERIRADGGEAMALPGDVTNEEEVKAYVRKVEDEWGKIDILVNNAAILGGRGVLVYDYDAYERQVRVITSGNFLNTKYVAHSMIERGIRGSIICTLSTAAWSGTGSVGYCTGKGGIVNFIRSCAVELAQYGIRVNGFTPIATQPDNPEIVEQWNARQAQATGGARQLFTPMGRQPTPTDYVPAVVFLASDESLMISGIDIKIDGAASSKHWRWVGPDIEEPQPISVWGL
ncbi:MAG: SDR family oxidoreductase [Chloroflexota bacterium]|nr:SDR family oxidoreductase [Chloroflexota bacterium]MDE2969070.1 SDR family oxidoreductase [Chloroflexota bacterium]